MGYLTISEGKITLPRIVIPRPVVEAAADVALETAGDYLRSPIVWIGALSLVISAISLLTGQRRGRR